MSSGGASPQVPGEVAAQRRILRFEGAVNLRDFGGYATEDGGRVATGRLYRCGTLADLTDGGKRAFAELDVKLICDLRRGDEKAAEPTPELAGAPGRLEIPIDPGSAVAMRERLDEGGLTLKERIDFMVGINRDLASNHAEDYARMFERLLELEDGAFLVHCSAGKDRTGFACALILHALGVSEATVLEDYLLTNEAMDYEGYVQKRIRAEPSAGEREGPVPRKKQLWTHLEADRESTMALFGVRPEYLRSAYDAIAAEFEGVEHYIEQAIGLDSAARQRLRSRYVVSAEA